MQMTIDQQGYNRALIVYTVPSCAHEISNKRRHKVNHSLPRTIENSVSLDTYTPCPGKNGPPKQNAVKCTVYNTIH